MHPFRRPLRPALRRAAPLGCVVVVLALLGVPGAARASGDEARVESAQPAAAAVEKPSLFKRLADPDRRFVVMPIPQSNPTVGTGIILTAGYFHPQSEADEAAGHPGSSTQGAVGYYDTGSWGGVVQHQGHYAHDTWRVSGVAGYVSLDLKFFGIGGEAGDNNQSIGWKLEGTALWPQVLRRVHGDWFLGGELRFIDSQSGFSVNVDPGGDKLGNVDTDLLEVTTVGIGPRIEHDSRDNRFNPYQGDYAQFAALINRRGIGSDTNHEVYDARTRLYRPLSENITLALDAKARFTGGDVPFFDLSRVELRGFSATRYMDRHALQFQAELRWRTFRRVGFVIFGGLGAVAPELDAFKSSTVAWGYGLGIRLLVAEKRRLNLRLDYAFTEDDSAVSVFVAEAF